MAAAEARAAWQRAANRCFVQEDARRAPKLACRQSPSPALKEADSAAAYLAEELENCATGFTPLNGNPSYSSLPPDTIWWLQMQPSFGYQKGLEHEQQRALEAELDSLKQDSLKSTSDKELEVQKLYTDTFSSMNLKESLGSEAAKESYEFIEMEPFGCYPITKVGNDCNFDPLIRDEKRKPWWQTTDQDELAGMVARKSLDSLQNCDLPPPQLCMRRHPFAQGECYKQCRMLVSIPDSSTELSSFSRLTTSTGEDSLYSADIYTKLGASAEQGDLQRDPIKPLSCCTYHKDSTKTRHISEDDACKAELMEALRHSQTRAREAEKAAKEAHAEKEHIIQLFFRQASQLFAYKQWIQLLQVEAICRQITNNDWPASTLCPVIPSWMSWSDRKPKRHRRRTSRGVWSKRDRKRLDIAKYAVAVALGLSLVGAGLLLGWTVGWMLPHLSAC